MIKLLTFISLCNFVALSALVAPYYQSVKEIDSIIESEELESLLGPSQPILEIKRTKSGYRISAPTKVILVDFVYEQNTQPGPKRYQLFFREESTQQ